MVTEEELIETGHRKVEGGYWMGDSTPAGPNTLLLLVEGKMVPASTVDPAKHHLYGADRDVFESTGISPLLRSPSELKEQKSIEAEAFISAEIVRPIVTPEQAKQLWNEYIELTRAILNDTDYAMIKGKKRKKKSAWRKYARFFNISDSILEKNIERDDDAKVIHAEFLVKVTAPNKRTSLGWGACSLHDRGHKEDKVNDNGKLTCKGPCDGRAHFSNPEHDIPAIAHTRAKNRAISDIIGAGETTAEEEKA